MCVCVRVSFPIYKYVFYLYFYYYVKIQAKPINKFFYKIKKYYYYYYLFGKLIMTQIKLHYDAFYFKFPYLLITQLIGR